jgi:hypothetical protein
MGIKDGEEVEVKVAENIFNKILGKNYQILRKSSRYKRILEHQQIRPDKSLSKAYYNYNMYTN